MKSDSRVSLDRLNEVFRYDPESGNLYWKVATAHRITVGDVAGCKDTHYGYVLVRIDNVLMQAQRIALRLSGVPIEGLQVDHIDGNPGNNALCNLRAVTQHQNMQNSKKRKSTFTSKWKGVSKCSGSSKWMARIYVGGKNLVLGRFSDEREAAEEYMFAAIKHFGEYARF